MHGIRDLCEHGVKIVTCITCLKGLRAALNHTDKTNIVDILASRGFKFKTDNIGLELLTDASGRGLPDTAVRFHFDGKGQLTSITAEREGD